jgi:hypothetical protein
MRRVNDQDGAVAVLVGILLVVLLGVGALVLDVGNLYWERRQLQTGAEAAALSAAQDYASGNGGAAEAGARNLADANDTRGAFVSDFAPNLVAQEVTVTARTGDLAGGGVLSSWLAQVIGNPDYFATATATARWGGVGGGATVPLTFSQCEWQQMTGGDVANLPTGERTVYFHSSQTAASINSCGGPANQDHPGGFGWLNPNGPGCSSIVNLGQVQTDTGNNVPNACTEEYLRSLIGGPPVLLPIFGSVTSQGNNATFQIIGFAALEVSGYRFSGSKFNEPTGDVPCSGNDRCIRGNFVAYYALDAVPSVGAPNFGVTTVQLTG